MGRLGLAMTLLLWLPGCAAMTALAAVPGALIEGAVYLFQGEEESLPASMRNALTSVQKGLRRMQLDVDVLEPVEEGYLIEFGNEKLNGDISLKQQTSKLTTIHIRVSRDGLREESVERAILEAVREISRQQNRRARFNFSGYHNIRQKPDIKARRIGWYKPGAMLKLARTSKKGWLKIKLPSGKSGYLKGSLPVKAKK